MATITYHPTDSQLAERIQADLAAHPGSDDLTAIVVLSPQAVADPAIQTAISEAIEAGRRVIPVLAKPTPLPRLVEHLEPVDFSGGYDFAQLAERLAAVTQGLQMKVHTPRTVAANKRTGLVVAALAVIMFVVALYAVGVLGIQAPPAEFAAVETDVAATRNAYIDAALPRTTDEAASFPATVDAAATALRPLLIATATAAAE
jgi:hypothetical protein